MTLSFPCVEAAPEPSGEFVAWLAAVDPGAADPLDGGALAGTGVAARAVASGATVSPTPSSPWTVTDCWTAFMTRKR